MKKMIFLISLASMTFAALPPLAQSTRELQAVLADSHLQDWLGSAEPIKDIIRTETGYLILTQNYAMKVDIQYGGNESRKVGPIPFQLHFHQPVHLKTGEVKHD